MGLRISLFIAGCVPGRAKNLQPVRLMLVFNATDPYNLAQPFPIAHF